VMDVSEVLLPGTTSELTFPVRNPSPVPGTITLSLHPMVPDWIITIRPSVLEDMQGGEIRPVTLTVQIPQGGTLPEDNSPVVDVEAFLGGEPIGGIRKIYRPPVPLHRPMDPIYAESEIQVRPYPPQAREPTEICVEVRNPTEADINLTLNLGLDCPGTCSARSIH